MAKGQQHSNREKRKPKQDKVKAAAPSISPFSSTQAKQKADKGKSGR